MKLRLHKPRREVWIVALVLLVVGLAAPSLPLLSGFAFYAVALSAALMLLGTWLF